MQFISSLGHYFTTLPLGDEIGLVNKTIIKGVPDNRLNLWFTMNVLLWSVLCNLIQRLHRTQIIWVCSDVWVFSVLENILLADNLSHLPKVLIWIRKLCIPSWWNSNALKTVNTDQFFHGIEYVGKCKISVEWVNAILLLHALVEQLRAFVAKQNMSRIHAFLVFFFTQIWLRQMRFDSDLTQISGLKNDGWSPC